MSLPLRPRDRRGIYFNFSDMYGSSVDSSTGSGVPGETIEEFFARLECSQAWQQQQQQQQQRSRSDGDLLEAQSHMLIRFDSHDLREWVIERPLGHGASSHVDLMRAPSGARFAVKKMRLTNRHQMNRQIIKDLEFMMRAVECARGAAALMASGGGGGGGGDSPHQVAVDHIIHFQGYAKRTFEAWIMMEVMDTCFGKILDQLAGSEGGGGGVVDELDSRIFVPEDVLGAVTSAVVKALNYLKQQHQMMHRSASPCHLRLRPLINCLTD